MPFSPKQEHVLNAIEHGWKPPKGAPFAGVGSKKASTMLTHKGKKGSKK